MQTCLGAKQTNLFINEEKTIGRIYLHLQLVLSVTVTLGIQHVHLLPGSALPQTRKAGCPALHGTQVNRVESPGCSPFIPRECQQ